MKSWKSLVFACVLISNFFENAKTENVKRILLNDPDMMNARINSMQHEIQEMRSELRDLKNQRSSQGATYIRWGRKTCPMLNGTSTVYSGIVGGRFYTDTDGGINTLCLPHNPDPAPTSLPIFSYSGRIFGSEYEFSYKGVGDNDDVPCAVCMTAHASSSIMIPAKVTCPQYWTKEYDGFLTSGAHYQGHTSTEFLCMDTNPEYLTEGARQHDNNGRLFYSVEAKCGSLPCPPYKDAELLSCVVCTL